MDAETRNAFIKGSMYVRRLTQRHLISYQNDAVIQSWCFSVFKFLTQTGIPILPPVQKTINHNGICAHMSVCMSGFRDNDLEEFIQQNGGNIVSGVSKRQRIWW